jgi:hypothetical protein
LFTRIRRAVRTHLEEVRARADVEIRLTSGTVVMRSPA